MAHTTRRRPAADVTSVDGSRPEDFRGPRHDRTGNELATAVLPVVKAMIASGRMFTASAEKGRPVTRPWWLADEDVADIAVDTVADALDRMHAALTGDRWDPEAGASLRTYLLGACVLSFPNALRRHVRSREGRMRPPDPVAPETMCDMVDGSVAVGAVDDAVAHRALVVDGLRTLDPLTARVVVLRLVDDLDAAETARLTGLSERAVEGRLYRGKASLRRHFGAPASASASASGAGTAAGVLHAR